MRKLTKCLASRAIYMHCTSLINIFGNHILSSKLLHFWKFLYFYKLWFGTRACRNNENRAASNNDGTVQQGWQNICLHSFHKIWRCRCEPDWCGHRYILWFWLESDDGRSGTRSVIFHVIYSLSYECPLVNCISQLCYKLYTKSHFRNGLFNILFGTGSHE